MSPENGKRKPGRPRKSWNDSDKGFTHRRNFIWSKLTTVTVSRLYKLYQEETLDGWATVNHLRELTWNAIQCIIFINALMPLVHVLRRTRLEWVGYMHMIGNSRIPHSVSRKWRKKTWKSQKVLKWQWQRIYTSVRWHGMTLEKLQMTSHYGDCLSVC